MRRVIYQSCEPHSYLVQLAKWLEEISERDGQDFEFVDLIDVLSGEDEKWVFSPKMGEHISADKIGQSYAVIWAPIPMDVDWFEKLTAGGYRGKKILLHSEDLNLSEGFRGHANYSFRIPQANLADAVYKALREQK